MIGAAAAPAPVPSGSGRGGRPRHLPLQLYLLALLALFVVGAGAAVVVERGRNLDRAEEATAELVELQASVGASQIESAFELAQRSVGELAANPNLGPLVEAPPSAGCSLSFSGTGPFVRGRIDIVTEAGAVVCSSEPLPPGQPYADAPWRAEVLREAGLVGPVADPLGDHDVLVVSAPIDGGFVATIVELPALGDQLTSTLSGTLPVSLSLDFPDDHDGTSDPGGPTSTGDTIAATAPIEPLGWQLRAAVDRDLALADARDDNRRLLLWFLVGVAVLVAATYALYASLVRPIRRLRRAVAGGIDDEPIWAPVRGPAEIVALGERIADLRHEVASELARREDAERTLDASRDSYQQLFAAHPVPMWVYDTETLQFLDVNEAAVATYGYTRDEFFSMTIRDIRPPEDHAALQAHVAKAGPADHSGPWRHIHKDGTQIEVEITSHVVDFLGRPARLVMAEDVTQRERNRRLLERAERMESLGQLAGGMAHDFNNVLAVILSHAEFVAEDLADAATTDPERWQPVLDDVGQIVAAGQRAAGLTRQLLAFARGEAAEAGPVDVNDVVREAEAMLRRTIGEQVDVEVSLEEGLWPVVANPGHLLQVVVNLAVNARDAMPSGGRLLIETANVRVDEEQHEARPELAVGPYVRLRVSDTGIGMDAEAREHAFEPFFTTKERGQGTGLGLATVYGIVSRAGGFVNLYSEPGLGTTVTVALPAAAETPEAPAVTLARSGRATGTGTVLVVEDDDSLRAVTARILANAGYQVLSAGDGMRALDVARSHEGRIDLLLTDVVMPGILGADLAIQLHEADPELRILFMSGYAPPLLLAGGTLPFGAPLIDKPFTAAQLTQRVHEVLDAPPPQRL